MPSKYANKTERSLIQGRMWRSKNRQRHRDLAMAGYYRNWDKEQERKKQYVSRNREKVRAWFRDRDRKSAAAKDNRYLSKCLRRRIKLALDGARRSGTVEKLMGCSIQQFRNHIESLWSPGMSWSNYGIGGWNIDHIIPCRAFDLSKEEHQNKCFHFSNLQPLWELDNFSKASRDRFTIYQNS